MLKYIYNIPLILLLSFSFVSCVDDGVKEENVSNDNEFNIDAFSNGYSVAFDLSLDKLGGDAATRDGDISDIELEMYENYLDPEEFRVLFFDSQDRFLFESKTRWFAKIESQGGGSRWRVGVPVFQYLSDGYDEHISTNPDLSIEDAYNWGRIAEIMRSEPFKIAILANRPSNINIPDLSDITAKQRAVDKFGINGPFWEPKNSVASYEYPENYSDVIKTVFDLHHCQYDPIYEGKNSTSGDCYDFIMDYDEESLPQMGAVSCWLNSQRKRVQGNSSYYFYKLPHGQIKDILTSSNHRANTDPSLLGTSTYITDIKNYPDPDQFIPMYGIQIFAPLTTWTKGTTYNLSQQTGSQTGGYDYKHITLLRSVVKLELRIPWYDKDNDELEVDNMYAQILGNNIFARCEPMDIWTPTDQIWNDNHMVDCEWLRIREYGLYANKDEKNDYRKRLSWFYGIWDDDNKWDLYKNSGSDFDLPEPPEVPDYPRIFNPITQRLTVSFITDCYLPIEGKYHRWVVYCGEHHMNDPNILNNLSERGIVSFFRIAVKKKKLPDNDSQWKVYTIPIADYTEYVDEYKRPLVPSNPAKKVLDNDNTSITALGYPDNMNKDGIFDTQKNLLSYHRLVQQEGLDPRYYPYPLLRNHHYRLTMSYGDDAEDINVEVMDGEKRIVGGIVFN